MFIDEAKICVVGGDGGAGCVAFHREKFRPKGGPSGGDGGNGGDVRLRADNSVATLSKFKNQVHWRATSGGHGSGASRHGKRGHLLVVEVPPGTSIRDQAGTLIADLVNVGDEVIVARGGLGGRGNVSFANASRRTPHFAEQGEFGEEIWLNLELRLLADAALVGMPNAGKSTLISRVSRAKPKIAAYPFTTLEPHLGVVRVDESEFVLADVPGLVEGASEGRGLGDRFLRHIERCRALVVMLDLFNVEGLDPLEQEAILLADLAAHDPGLLDRPRLTVANKIDAGRDDFDELHLLRPDIEGISAVSGEGVGDTMRRLASLVDGAREAEPERLGYVLHRPEPHGFSVKREGGEWLVSGRDVERVVAMADLTNSETLAYVRTRMRAIGVDDALKEAGVTAGDDIRIGEVVFEWEDEGDHGRG